MARILFLFKRRFINFVAQYKFMTHKENETDLKEAIIDSITDLKGKDISIVDMTHIESAPMSMFIIAQGSSSTNVASMADHVREKVQQTTGIKPYNYDGYAASEWIVIDYGHLLVHLFVPETRERYRLEELWSDAVITDIPNLD